LTEQTYLSRSPCAIKELAGKSDGHSSNGGAMYLLNISGYLTEIDTGKIDAELYE